MADDYIDRITRFLKEHDIDRFEFIKLAKHRAVLIQHGGQSHRIVFPATGSDWRGPANAISDIRHTIGCFEATAPRIEDSRRPRRRVPHRRQARRASPASFSEPTVPRPDKFFGPLMALKARFEAEATSAGTEVSRKIESATPMPTPVRVALRTPWLGKQTRYITI